MSVRDIYRDRASLGHLPVLKGQTLIETPYRLQLDASTIGLWWFDENANGAVSPYGVTTLVADKATTPHIGTTLNTTTWGTTGPWGSDLAFVRTNTAVVLLASGCDVASNDVTVEVVFKAETVPTASPYDNTWQFGLVERGPLTGAGGWWCLAIRGGPSGAQCGKPIWYLRATAEDAVIGANRVDDGLYHYMAGTIIRSSNAAALYVDGVSVASGNLGIGAGALDSYTLMFGKNSSSVDSFTGSIATVRISTVARTAGEILTNAKLMGFA
jgi:hypothetical protein